MTTTTSVLILCQPAETDVAALTLHHLVRDLGADASAHVLMNGGFAGELQAASPASPHIRFWSSPGNLGVAGGRNFLLRLPEVQASDVVVILDNDVITPPGHIERLVGALASDPRAGVIGPAVLHLPGVARALDLSSDGTRREPVDHARLASLDGVLREEDAWFHLGTHPDWRAAYLDEVQIEQRLVARAGGVVEPFHPMHHHDPRIRAEVADGSQAWLPVANVAGCCQVFRRELLDEVGYLMDEFSPYGFEDVEFCIRVAESGRTNYVVPGILMLHGTDHRHAARRAPSAAYATQRNYMRCKTLLAWRHASATWQATVEAIVLRRYLASRQSESARAAQLKLRAHVAGVSDAKRQIAHAERGVRTRGVR